MVMFLTEANAKQNFKMNIIFNNRVSIIQWKRIYSSEKKSHNVVVTVQQIRQYCIFLMWNGEIKIDTPLQTRNYPQSYRDKEL